jgi:hypothetical protein
MNIQKIGNSLLGLCIMCLTTLSVSCSEDEAYDFPGDAGKVYVRMQTSHTVNSVANVAEFTVRKTLNGTFGSGTISFPVRCTMPAQGEIRAFFDVDNSLIDVYNTIHQTDYQSMKSNILAFSKKDLVISNGAMQSDEEIVVSFDEENVEALAVGKYLVPIRMMHVEGGMEVSSNWNVVYLILEVVDDPYGFPAADRSGWTIVDCSSEETNAENAPATNVLDGNNGTIWHTEYDQNQPNPPHTITIDMGEVGNMIGFCYTTRSSGSGCPLGLKVEVSANNADWEEVATYGDDELPTGGSAECKKFFEEQKAARYFRLTITKAGQKYWGSIYESHYACLAEVGAFLLNK